MDRLKYFYLLICFCTSLFSCRQASDKETRPATTEEINNRRSDSIIANAIPSWAIDAATSKINFTIKNLGMNVEGTLDNAKGLILFDERNLKGSKFEVSVNVNTISTGIKKRDKDLMAEKFFDQEKFREIVFRSVSIKKIAIGYEMTGNLIIKGISEQIKVPFALEKNGEEGIFKSNFKIDRLDFKVGGMGPVMSSEVNVSIQLTTKKFINIARNASVK